MSEVDNQNNSESPFSLINYEAQIQISQNIDEYHKAKHASKKLDPNPSPQDVLNNMITPRDWQTDSNKFFMQYVSHTKSSRDDVFSLKQKLQQALEHRQARKQGICPIRESLFSQAFDEVLRQVTINCPQRGLLLMRVRDEHKMTLASYQTLYKSSTQYGMRKQLQSEQGMDELQEQLKRTQLQHKMYHDKKIQLQCKKQFLQKKIQQRNMIDEGDRQYEVQQINQQARNLQFFLQTFREEKLKQTNLASKQGNSLKDSQKKNQ